MSISQVIKDRLEYLRGELRAERMSYAELAELRAERMSYAELAELRAERMSYAELAELRAERMSYAELAELESLAEHIEPGDVELLEAAGVPEFPE